MRKVLVFGSLNVDYAYHVDEIVLEGQTIQSTELNRSCGGKGLNQAIAIARSGCEVCMAGCIGNDGAMLIKMLKENNVDTSLVKVIGDTQSGHAIIQVDSTGKNAIVIYPGANHEISIQYVEEVLSNFRLGDIIVIQNEINCIDTIIQRSKEKGLYVVCNPSPFDNRILDLELKNVDLLVLNEDESRRISGRSRPEGILSSLSVAFPNTDIVLTLGHLGVRANIQSTQYLLPAFETKVVDTTGAGDTFLGYLVGGLSKKEATSTILRESVIAAGLACGRKGAADSIPWHDEVMQFAIED